MSRPAPSAPSHIRKPPEPRSPGSRRASITVTLPRSYGFCGARSGAKSARKRMIISTANAAVATGFEKNSRAMRRVGVSGFGSGSVSATALISLGLTPWQGGCEPKANGGHTEGSCLGLSQANPRIEKGVQNVHNQVDNNKHQHGDDEIGHDHRPIEALDGVDEELAH